MVIKKKGGNSEKTLIISTGDASDFDGFMSLPLYYKAAIQHNCDVAFVMNYPAYYNNSHIQENVDQTTFRILDTTLEENKTYSGLGYAYGYDHFAKTKYPNSRSQNVLQNNVAVFKNMLQQTEDLNLKSEIEGYLSELQKSQSTTDALTNLRSMIQKTYVTVNEGGDVVIETNNFASTISQKDKDMSVMTLITKYIVDQIWKWCKSKYQSNSTNKPKIIFCLGGVNSFNPFSAEAIKDENMVYGPVCMDYYRTNVTTNFANAVKMSLEGIKDSVYSICDSYKSIYIDMNGSMAWYKQAFSTETKEKVKAVFVMGGVLNYSQVNTLGSNPFLNRLSCATMNQLYHGERTGNFFNDFRDKLYFITNNEINNNFNYTNPSDTYDLFTEQMDTIGLIPTEQNHIIRKCFDAYYFSRPRDRKPFDVISSFALVKHMSNAISISQTLNLTFDRKYGITILGTESTTEEIKSKFVDPNFGMYGKVLNNYTVPFIAGTAVEVNYILPRLQQFTLIPSVKGVFASDRLTYETGIRKYLLNTPDEFTFTFKNQLAVPIRESNGGGGNIFNKTDERVSIPGRKNAVVYKKKGDKKKYVKVNGGYTTVTEAKKR